MLYTRNRIYISDDEQNAIKDYRLFIAGCGIGSVIAECALRMGFENITIVDGDLVEESNLNRQNYVHFDIGTSKVESLKKRLESINPASNITVHKLYLTEKEVKPLVKGHDVAINALDFQSDVPLRFDEYCQQNEIPVLHPYNIGWAALLFIIMPKGQNLTAISTAYEGFEKKVVEFFLRDGNTNSSFKREWIEEVLTKYTAEKEKLSPPQLSVASWLLGGLCTDVLVKLATKKKIKEFPDCYFVTAE